MPRLSHDRTAKSVSAARCRGNLQRALLGGCALLVLASCGGSGEDGGTTDYSVDTPVGADSGGSGILGSYYVSTFAPYEALAAQLRSSALYAVQQVRWSFSGAGTSFDSFAPASARVEYAHAAGLTGKGQVISIVDAGFLTTHETIADSIVNTQGNLPVHSHGTGVASVAAGYSDTMVGVAPNASLALGAYGTTSSLTNATNAARNLGAVVQNNSWGFVDPVNGGTLYVSADSFQTVFGTGNTYSAALESYAADGVVVFAVSNDTSDTNSGLMEALPLLMPQLESGWLAVGNAVPDFDASGINSVQLISSACHEAAAWCLLADGSWMSASGTADDAYRFATGSSFAAPQVSGALALLAEAFPTLTPHDLRLRLLASADNSFFSPTDWLEIESGLKHGYDETYGHGFLDIRAALLPIGTPRVTLSNGDVVMLDQPAVVSGSAFGDAVTRGLAAVDISATDSLSAEFRTSGATLAATAGLPELGTTRLARAFSTGLETRRVARTGGISEPFEALPGRTLAASLPGDGLSTSVLVPEGGAGDYGLSVSTALSSGSSRLDLGLKVARDQGTVLGLGDDSAGSDLFAVQLALSQDLAGDGFLSLTGEVGLADLQGADIFSGVSTASFNSLGVEVGTRNVAANGDRLAFGAKLPMAVTSGRAVAVLPVTRAAGSTSHEAIAIDLAPEARQMDFAVSYQRPFGDNLELMLEFVHSQNQGNRANAQDSAAIVALTWAF
ncbi:S8 family serine peptidase [Defluviimonas sp. WL0002]|uniref:S8 family serine peptidase n=1 Tax=Albidovulum marisflavi TaxID=2984159 RepID=A0ABT2ZGT8_9RHOB|nr:S8 family peptidase [Defluviimonas sp. WL0002]MCV2869941.1 S8 family serine peptidase [Defluviimonas sp. WL0002]